MMVVQEKLYTAEELAQMPDDGRRRELVKGVLIEMSPAGDRHTVLGAHLSYYIYGFTLAHELEGYVTGADGGFMLFNDPDTVRAPNVAYVSKAKLPEKLTGKFFPGAPDLAVEIVSPNDRADDIQEKVTEYLEAGTLLVWVFYPKTRAVVVHTPDGSHTLGVNDVLHGDPALPGFNLPVRDAFSVLDE